MRTIDCKNLRQEIDGATPGRLRSAFANRHMAQCQDCALYGEQTVKLQELLSGLGTIEAPGDFDFRLRARLSGEKPANFHFPLNGFSFGLRGAAVAALLFIFGSAVFFSLRTPPDTSLTANNPAPAVTTSPNNAAPAPATALTAPAAVAQVPSSVEEPATISEKPAASSPRRHLARSNSRMASREMASRPATIIKASDLNASADYPIQASTQPVRVSLENGKGNSRTISLPPVSFGSQRVMSQGSAPLIASARGSW